MKKFTLLLSVAFCVGARADIFCRDADQSLTLQITETEVTLRLSKWAAPESVAGKMNKGPGKAKAVFSIAFTRKTGSSVALARESCVFGKDDPFLMVCQFVERAPIKVKLALEGSNESQTFDIDKMDLRTQVDSLRFVDALGIQQERKIAFTGKMAGPSMPSGFTVAIEFLGKDCRTAP